MNILTLTQKTLNLLTLALSLALLTSCTSVSPQLYGNASNDKLDAYIQTPESFQKNVRQIVRQDTLFAVMTAEIAAQKGDLDTAVITLIEAATYLKDPELAKRAVEVSLTAGDGDRALESAKIWTKIDPDNLQASRSVMMLQLSTNRVDQALPSFKAYINELYEQERQNPGVTSARPLQVILDLLLRIPDKAKAYTTGIQLLGDKPNQTEEQYILAQLADAADLIDPAINHLRHVLQVIPQERHFLLMAQFLEKKHGNPDQAIQFLSQQVDRQPNWFATRLYLARLFTQLNEWQKAGERFAQLIQLQPTNYALYSSQGFVMTKLAKLEEAEKHFLVYLANTEPRDLQNEELIYISMAELYSKQKDYVNAMNWLKKAPNIDQSLDIQLMIHKLYRQQNRISQASEVLKRFKPQNTNDAVRLTLALSQFVEEFKKPEKAIIVLDQALTNYPDQEDLLYERAMVSERLNDVESVELYLRRLIQVNPDNPHGYNALGYTFAEKGIRLSEALELIKKAHDLAPQDPYILDSLGWVHYKLGHLTTAEETLRKAFAIRQDEEIGLHLLEIVIVTGQLKEARQIADALKKQYPNSNELRNLTQRIQGF